MSVDHSSQNSVSKNFVEKSSSIRRPSNHASGVRESRASATPPPPIRQTRHRRYAPSSASSLESGFRKSSRFPPTDDRRPVRNVTRQARRISVLAQQGL